MLTLFTFYETMLGKKEIIMLFLLMCVLGILCLVIDGNPKENGRKKFEDFEI